MANEYEREYARKRGIPLWQVANGFHCSESNFYRILRVPFTDDQKKIFKQTCDEIMLARIQEAQKLQTDE